MTTYSTIVTIEYVVDEIGNCIVNEEDRTVTLFHNYIDDDDFTVKHEMDTYTDLINDWLYDNEFYEFKCKDVPSSNVERQAIILFDEKPNQVNHEMILEGIAMKFVFPLEDSGVDAQLEANKVKKHKLKVLNNLLERKKNKSSETKYNSGFDEDGSEEEDKVQSKEPLNKKRKIEQVLE